MRQRRFSKRWGRVHPAFFCRGYFSDSLIFAPILLLIVVAMMLYGWQMFRQAKAREEGASIVRILSCASSRHGPLTGCLENTSGISPSNGSGSAVSSTTDTTYTIAPARSMGQNVLEITGVTSSEFCLHLADGAFQAGAARIRVAANGENPVLVAEDGVLDPNALHKVCTGGAEPLSIKVAVKG